MACLGCASALHCLMASSLSDPRRAVAAVYTSRCRSGLSGRQSLVAVEHGKHRYDSIRVLLVDDQRLMREGLRTLLELHRDLSVGSRTLGGCRLVLHR